MIITSLTSVAVSFRSASPATGSPTPTPAVSATDVSTTTSSVPTDTVDGELTSALPKPSQRPARRQPQSGQETAPSTSTDTPSVAGSAVVSVPSSSTPSWKARSRAVLDRRA